jgi:hypothetical protein
MWTKLKINLFRSTYDLLYGFFQIGQYNNTFYHKIWRNFLRITAKFCLISIRSTFSRLTNFHVAGAESDIVVSLTSFPKRLKDLDLVIFTILAQRVLPRKIVVYFSTLQVENFESLPQNLKSIQSEILEYRFVNDDLRAHKKYFYAVQEYSDFNIVTIDDDILYPLDLIRNFKTYSNAFPNCVICNEACLVVSRDGNAIYDDFPIVHGFSEDINLMCIGAKSVYYPPGTLNENFKNVDMLKQCSLSNDDLWLYAMTKLNNRRRIKTKKDLAVIPLKYSDPENLCDINVLQKYNDIQMRRIQDFIYSKYDIKIF